MNPSEGVEREARRIADCRKISDEHGERIYKDVLDALTQAEKRGFERARAEAAKKALNWYVDMMDADKHDGDCTQECHTCQLCMAENLRDEIRNLTYEKKGTKNAKTN